MMDPEPGSPATGLPGASLTIGHVDAERGFSGGEKQVFLLVEGLRRAGLRNVIFCAPGSATEERARELDFECIPVAMRNDLDGAGILRLARGFRTAGLDLVHLHTGRATWLGGFAARRAGLPAITTRRQDRDQRPGWRTNLVYGRLTRRVVAISPAVGACLAAGGVPAERIVEIASTVDPALLAAHASREDVRSRLGADADEFVFLAAGALVARKGLDVLLAALAELDPERRPLIWIAGEGPERSALEAQAATLEVSGHVRFLGSRDDIPDLLGACDAFVMPSRREGLGVAALEALAVGRAVVASRIGGLGGPGGAVTEECGLLVPAGDAQALAAALGRLAGDRALTASMGAAGARRVQAHFHVDGMVASYTQLYREVLEEVRGAS